MDDAHLVLPHAVVCLRLQLVVGCDDDDDVDDEDDWRYWRRLLDN